MKIKQNKYNLFDYFIDGPSLLFIKFLYEHKPIIYDMILDKPKTYQLKKFISELKKLVEYNFTEKEYENELPKEYISNVLYEILTYEYCDLNKIDIFHLMEKNMNQEYLLKHFELWWYQSMYMVGGGGYIRNLNNYLKKYWDTDEFFTEEELNKIIKKSYSRHNLPRLFSEEEFDIFMNGYNPYYPPDVNKHPIYEDGSRMF